MVMNIGRRGLWLAAGLHLMDRLIWGRPGVDHLAQHCTTRRPRTRPLQLVIKDTG